jgi:hypothetical protein
VLKYYFVVYILVCIGHALSAQSVRTLTGARAEGMAYTSACLYDPFAVFNNIAGISRVTHTSAGFTYEAHPQLKSFNRMAAVVVMPIGNGTTGVGLYKFGDDLYSEQILTAGYSNTFGLASLGLKINYVQYRLSEFRSKGFLSFSFGGIANLTSNLNVGAHITNLTQPKISDRNKEYLPTILTAGFSFTPSSKLLLASEIEKDLEYSATWKCGFEYKPFKKFSFRSGFNINPDSGYGGFGFHSEKFSLDYAFGFQGAAGYNHHATVTYHFPAKKK